MSFATGFLAGLLTGLGIGVVLLLLGVGITVVRHRRENDHE